MGQFSNQLQNNGYCGSTHGSTPTDEPFKQRIVGAYPCVRPRKTDYEAQKARVPGRRRIHLISLYPEAIMYSPPPVAPARPGAITSTSTILGARWTTMANSDKIRAKSESEASRR